MIIAEVDYIEHHGVRGMKWGVRKTRSSTKTPKTPEQKKRRNEKILGGALLIAGGALFAKMILDQHKTMSARNAANIYNASKKVKVAQQINDIISMNTGVRTVTLAKSLGR